jgi:hypothetical protein
MEERRQRKFFHFTEDDLLANSRGKFSERQRQRLEQEAKAEQASARSSAAILFVVATAGLAIGLTIGYIAPSLIGRILILFFMGILWPSVWAGKGIQIIRSAKVLQEPRLRTVSGKVHILRHEPIEYVLQVGGFDFDLDGNPAGVVMEGDEYTIHYLEANQEILSVEQYDSENKTYKDS